MRETISAARVCFAVPGVYPLLKPSIPGVIGGSESRALLFARGLSRLGRYAVSLVAFDYGQPRVEQYEALIVYRDDAHCFRRDGSNRGQRMSGRFQSIGRVLRRWLPAKPVSEAEAWAAANADIYCSFGVSSYTGRLARWCRAEHRPLVLFAGSERDFSVEYRPGTEEVNVYGSRFSDCYDAVMLAQTFVVQTQRQAQLLHDRFGREATVIRNPIDLDGGPASRRTASERGILWIGKSNTTKGPELVPKLARMCPGVRFTMVMNRVDEAIHTAVLKSAPPNLEIIERASPEQIADLFADSLALLNTSPLEGFPNTFLEAGKYGVPVLSLSVDPDGVVTKHAGGIVGQGDVPRLAEAIRTFHANPDMAAAAGKNWQRYVRRHHALPERLAELDELLQAILKGAGRLA